MKILFFIEGLGSGGKERRLVELIRQLSTSPEYKMELVLLKKIVHYKDILSLDIKIHYPIRKKIKKDPRVFFNFLNIARKFDPEVIHVWGNLPALYAIPAKLILKIPIVNNQITNAPSRVPNSIIDHRITFHFSNQIISNTQAGLESYSAPIKKSKVVYNGFDFNRLKDLRDRSIILKKFNIKTKYVVGMVASFSKKKDYLNFINGANIILEKNKNITFLCIGKGDSNEFEILVKDTNIDNILFLGRQDNVESIMNVCDIGVLLTNTKYHGEGISNAILEFSALGIPVIATNGGGTSEIIEDGYSGFLINSNSSNEFVERTLYLLENIIEMKSFGENAKEIVHNKFSIDKMIDSFKSIYKDL